MKRLFIQLHGFSRVLDQLIEEKKLLNEDFENLEKELLEEAKQRG